MSKSTLARESWVHTSLLARLMSCPLVIRLVIAMTLLPSVSCPEAMRTLAGLLVSVPFTRDWHVPTGKCIGEWRMLTPLRSGRRCSGIGPWAAAGRLGGASRRQQGRLRLDSDGH